MGAYNGHATITAGDTRVEVLIYAQSGIRDGRPWWGGTFSTIDDGGAFALHQAAEAVIELADENDTGRVSVPDFKLRIGGAGVATRCRFNGVGDPPRSLAG